MGLFEIQTKKQHHSSLQLDLVLLKNGKVDSNPNTVIFTIKESLLFCGNF
jgi:hypothetical protein